MWKDDIPTNMDCDQILPTERIFTQRGVSQYTLLLPLYPPPPFTSSRAQCPELLGSAPSPQERETSLRHGEKGDHYRHLHHFPVTHHRLSARLTPSRSTVVILHPENCCVQYTTSDRLPEIHQVPNHHTYTTRWLTRVQK